MQNITPDMLWTTIIVLVAVCGLALTVTGLIKNVRDLRKPQQQEQTTQHEQYMRFFSADKTRIENNERMIGDVERRIDPLENNVKEQSKDIRVLMGGVIALLDHELHNGNENQMQAAKHDIETRLIERR